jgi:hypothetical protein
MKSFNRGGIEVVKYPWAVGSKSFPNNENKK